MLIRLPLKKAPKFISYALWSVVAFRLIVPFSFESIFSLMPQNTNVITIPRDIIYQQNLQINSGVGLVDSTVNKIVAFLLLSIHWFNPLVWTGFILMSTDMELSCDERVLKQMNEATKKPYANSLLSLATGRHILNGSPVSKSRDEVRDKTNQIHFEFRGFGNNGDMANIYFNFSKDFSEVWADNGVKPSLSYGVKKPGKVKDFFEMQFGSVTVATEIGSAEETGDYNASKKNDNALTFWIKPDEAGHVMGEVAAIQWLNSYKGDDVPETERIRDYVINDVELIAVDMATSDAQMYDYMVTINYSITTASEEYLALEDNISGKGTFDGLHRELYVKGLGKGNFQIVDVSEDALSVRQEIELPNFKYDGQDSIKKLVYDTEIERDSASNNRGGFIIVAPR